ncbi:MAG: AbrB/MazE/SpoVT family DNA-binding domain-containing protein [Rhodospirillaceae bacterium]|jgi:putative addiction module antidote|nr:AbrB/MazE/SpoVT family DNA-binding domain-containing protein [Rhodospirillales bacterium]MBT3907991.1 AbrB/MazE/SpoVT family DNA-binding domain-containing protein [Rhodospirillaceae bacterium]MBT4702264.1 AbrB/MazE/SpoVT family DNA-binding domain-containing protein [Rhodospirillaceae bacterium]MBT5036650.1 AbrB/MazE/SpoVT family DNA-binding domain-containing protein [Rhodospirillaceae bacterium]MBT6220880.1 AbrB/MazE/SpoVT family DNA-binding domain-containing protein [Rhodospirillaceae bacte
MSTKLKLRKVGTSLGFTVPKEVLKDLRLEEGSEFYLVDTPDGVLMTPYDPDFEQALDASQDFMRRYPNAMKKLAEG